MPLHDDEIYNPKIIRVRQMQIFDPSRESVLLRLLLQNRPFKFQYDNQIIS